MTQLDASTIRAWEAVKARLVWIEDQTFMYPNRTDPGGLQNPLPVFEFRYDAKTGPCPPVSVPFGIWGPHFTDDDLDGSFTALDSLTYLNLGGNRKVTEAGLLAVAKMKNLTTLTLPSSSGRFLKELKNLPKLRVLACTTCSDTGAATLGQLDKLEKLCLSGTRIGDRGLTSISKLSQLRDLNLAGTKFTPSGLRVLSSLHSLNDLNLGDGLTDGVLVVLREMQMLHLIHQANRGQPARPTSPSEVTYVDFASQPITDAGLQLIREFVNLKTINLAMTNVTSESIQELARYPLQDLVLGVEFTDDVVAALVETGQVHCVDWVYATTYPFTRAARDAEITVVWAPNTVTERGLNALATLTNVREIRTRCLSVTDNMIELLRLKNPHCRIKADRPDGFVSQ